MTYELKYIIFELGTGIDHYRILEKESGKMRDMIGLTQEQLIKNNVDTSHAAYIEVKNLQKFTGMLKTGVNDFETWCRLNDRLDLLAEYDTSKNEKPVHRISKGSIDKEGRYHKLVVGDNDLETYCKRNGFELLLKEYSQLNPKEPNEIAAFADESVIWECSRCHNMFKNHPRNRVKGQSCPRCSSTGSSTPEQMIYYFLSEEIAHIEHRKKIDGLEADIYLPDYKTIIDYRGEYWHSKEEAQQKDIQKYEYFKSKGLRQIVINENRGKNAITQYNTQDGSICFKPNQYDKLFSILKEMLGLNVGINDRLIRRVQHIVVTSKQRKEVINSIDILYPDVARRWDKKKNGDFLPSQVTPGTSLKAWFVCDDCKRSYYSFIRKQVIGQGCPYCNGTATFRGINDIATTHPGIIYIWDWEKNDANGITPYNIKAGSSKNVHFKCFNCDAERITHPDIITAKDTFKCRNCGIQLNLK